MLDRDGMKKKCLIVSIVGILAILFLSSVTSTVSADWRDSTSLSKNVYTLFIDQHMLIVWTLENTGTSYFDVWDFTVHFDWQTSSSKHDLLNSTKRILAGNLEYFLLDITIPQVGTGSHTANIEIVGEGSSDWWPLTYSETDSFDVKEIPPLEISCSVNRSTGSPPLIVQFTSTVSGGLEPYEYFWDFGDGNNSTSPNPTHTYLINGTYEVTLRVTDSKTAHQVKSDTITVIVGDQNGWISYLIVIVILVIIIITVFILLRRSNKGGQRHRYHGRMKE